MLIAYGITLVLFALYSYTQLDLNITFSKWGGWAQFRDAMVQVGYFHRFESTILFFILLGALWLLHWKFMSNHRRHSAMKVAFLTGGILLAAYPFLSHDLFNYMFDAKILTYYHQNPYLHRAMDFGDAPELRFMHWIHRTYPYGPTFLPLTLIPSFLGLGKFVLSYGLFKAFFTGFYLLSVWALNRQNKEWALFFATHPLVIIEGLMNSHNDLIAIGLAIYGSYLVFSRREVWGRVLLLISGGIKYITLPFVFVKKKSPKLQFVIFLMTAMLLGYLTFVQEVQAWYYLVVFGFLPFAYRWIRECWIGMLGLLVSYYPFLLYGTWGEKVNVDMKHATMLAFAIINGVALFIRRKQLIQTS